VGIWVIDRLRLETISPHFTDLSSTKHV